MKPYSKKGERNNGTALLWEMLSNTYIYQVFTLYTLTLCNVKANICQLHLSEHKYTHKHEEQMSLFKENTNACRLE